MITLLNTTIFRTFRPAFVTRESILEAFTEVPLARKRVEGPLFVFAHIPAPHYPFLFDSNGNPQERGGDDKAKYVEQLKFVNKKVTGMVDKILATSDPTPVIVIQGDHGPYLDENNRDAYETENLNAILVPNGENLL